MTSSSFWKMYCTMLKWQAESSCDFSFLTTSGTVLPVLSTSDRVNYATIIVEIWPFRIFGLHWPLMAFIGLCWPLLVFAGLCWPLLAFTGFCFVLLCWSFGISWGRFRTARKSRAVHVFVDRCAFRSPARSGLTAQGTPKSPLRLQKSLLALMLALLALILALKIASGAPKKCSRR